MTNRFLLSCQSLRTTTLSKDPCEATSMTSTAPALGIESTSIRLMNRTSLLEMVSGVSFPSRLPRRDGTLRLISTVCTIQELGLSLPQPRDPLAGESEFDDQAAGRNERQERSGPAQDAPGTVDRVRRVAHVPVIQHVGDVDERNQAAAGPGERAVRAEVQTRIRRQPQPIAFGREGKEHGLAV